MLILIRYLSLFLFIIITVKLAANNEVHTFTGQSGQTIRASIINATSSTVTIQRVDGRQFTNKINVYSQRDQEYIKKWAAENTQNNASPAKSIHNTLKKGRPTLIELTASLTQLKAWFEQGYIGITSNGTIEIFQEVPKEDAEYFQNLNERIKQFYRGYTNESKYDNAVSKMTFIIYRKLTEGGDWRDMRKERAGAPQDLTTVVGKPAFIKRNQIIYGANEQQLNSGDGGMADVSSIDGDFLYVTKKGEYEGWVRFDAIEYKNKRNHYSKHDSVMDGLYRYTQQSTKSIEELINPPNSYQIKQDTLLFNGYYLGMPLNDCVKLISHHFKKSEPYRPTITYAMPTLA